MPSKEASRLKEERERLREDHLAGASGLSVVRALSDVTDAAIREVWGNLEPPKDALVAAVGGYGRQELSPFSDIDLLLIHPKPSHCADAMKALSYALWDAGLELGAAVYSPKESLKLARGRFDVATSLLDSRLLIGDEDLFVSWQKDCREILTHRDFETKLSGAVSEWRLTGGETGADLEPDIKLGRGGLRDLAALRWISTDPPINDQQLDLLFTLRNQLHFMTGRRTDRLLMQLQSEAASVLMDRFHSNTVLNPEEQLLRELYRAARKVAAALDRRIFPDPDNDELARAFSSLVPDSTARWEEDIRSCFFSILRGLPTTGRAFWTIADDGLRVAMPEWTNIQCLPQRNVYHRFAVDVHSLEVVSVAARLHEHPDELTRRVAADSKREADLLLMACLLHDIGKGHVEDHSEAGAKIAGTAVDRMHLASPDAEDLVWLVGNHLLLAETATRRDIGDESLIIEIAEKIQTERRLRLLFLLTIADGVATGPSAWSRWKATLVARLFTRVNRLLEQGELAGGDATRAAAERTDHIVDSLRDRSAMSVRAHIEAMPRAWLLSQEPTALIQQTAAMIEPPVGDEVKVTAEPQQDAGIWEVMVVARDRPGLFSKVSGTLALHGLNVLGAQIYTRQDGVALEVFRVEQGGGEEGRFEQVATDTEKALRGRISLDVRLAQKRRDYSWRVSKGKQEPPRVLIDNQTSDYHTIIEVHATDRTGLLYVLTKALADLGLDIHLAKVSTYAEDVVDAFYVTDLDGQKLADPEHANEVEKALLHRIEVEA